MLSPVGSRSRLMQHRKGGSWDTALRLLAEMCQTQAYGRGMYLLVVMVTIQDDGGKRDMCHRRRSGVAGFGVFTQQ